MALGDGVISLFDVIRVLQTSKRKNAMCLYTRSSVFRFVTIQTSHDCLTQLSEEYWDNGCESLHQRRSTARKGCLVHPESWLGKKSANQYSPQWGWNGKVSNTFAPLGALQKSREVMKQARSSNVGFLFIIPVSQFLSLPTWWWICCGLIWF